MAAVKSQPPSPPATHSTPVTSVVSRRLNTVEPHTRTRAIRSTRQSSQSRLRETVNRWRSVYKPRTANRLCTISNTYTPSRPNPSPSSPSSSHLCKRQPKVAMKPLGRGWPSRRGEQPTAVNMLRLKEESLSASTRLRYDSQNINSQDDDDVVVVQKASSIVYPTRHHSLIINLYTVNLSMSTYRA